MNWNDWIATIAAIVGILVPCIIMLAWMVRRWIHELIDKVQNEVTPKLSNDGTSVATYAHEALTVARETRDLIVKHITDTNVHNYQRKETGDSG